MTPPQHPPRPGIHLAPPPRSTDVEKLPWTLDALGSAVSSVAGKVEALTASVDKEDDGIKASLVAIRRDVTALAKSTETAWSELGALRGDVENVNGGVLEAIAIAKRVEQRQKDDARALRESSSNLERVTLDHSTDLLKIRTLVAPLMAEASREGSARASKQVGVFGAIATTAAVVAPHVPWGEIGSAISRVLGG